MDINELCAAPPEAPAHSPSQMPLSCPVAPKSQRELLEDGGGGGGGVARRARAAWAPKARSCAKSCGTSSATPCAASLTCPSFTYHLRASVAWVPPLADNDGKDKHKNLQDEHLKAPVLRGARHVLRHVLRQVLHVHGPRAALSSICSMVCGILNILESACAVTTPELVQINLTPRLLCPMAQGTTKGRLGSYLHTQPLRPPDSGGVWDSHPPLFTYILQISGQ